MGKNSNNDIIGILTLKPL